MKKFALIALVFVLVLSLTACGRNNDDTTQDNNQTPSTDLPILPDTTDDDTTNIPDPEVNGNSTDSNNGSEMMPGGNGDASTNSGSNGGSNGSNGSNGGGNNGGSNGGGNGGNTGSDSMSGNNTTNSN